MSTPITLEYLIKNTDQPLINLLDIKDDFRNETPVEDLFVNPGANRETRVINALRRGRICNLENVMNVKFSYIYRLRNMGKVSITVLLNAIFNHYHIESHIPCLKGKSDYQEEYKNIVSTIEPVLLQEISECMFQNLSLEQQRKLLKIIQGRMVLLGEIKMEKNRFDMSLLELIELYKEKKQDFYSFRENVYMKNVNEHDEIAKRRHHNQYEELRMEILNVSSFIAEKLLK